MFVLTLIPFLFYGLRQDLIGSDSYLYLLGVCDNQTISQFNSPLSNDTIQKTLFSFIPCNIIALKALLFALCFLSLLIIVKIACLFDKKNAWLAGLSSILLTSLLFFEFFKFENDQFGWPILFTSIYFWVKAKQAITMQEKANNIVIAILFVGIAGVVWHGSILFLFAFGLSFFPALVLFGLFFVIFGFSQLLVFLPNFRVTENWPVVGLVAQQFLLAGLFKIPKLLLFETIFFVLLAAMNAKYTLLALPFLAIGTMEYIKNFNPKFKYLLVGVCLGVYAMNIANIFLAEPKTEVWQAIAFALNKSIVIQNDWDLGYTVAWAGGKPSVWAGGDTNNFKKEGIILTQFEQPCLLLKKFKRLLVYDCG